MRLHTSTGDSGTQDDDGVTDGDGGVKSCDYVSIPKFRKAVLVVIDGLRYDFLMVRPVSR